ncbi:outer membrane protein assembly complex, YaeT protein [Thermodesulfatator indicus DSM 15286]|uniref:Outer membrane protein assembly factor BamA n=1 Tax=Thermodesulfatator indicus (strain DSM 15286 / JCM 11887 / CIR29812) TaxID=667014 RepID=F8ABG9_THEID|nr:outer membrane protein assembly complex, YaeT protein [Thermodesulfatator indicus DSM 15286]
MALDFKKVTLFLLSILFFLSCLGLDKALAEKKTLLFLPLKINAPKNYQEKLLKINHLLRDSLENRGFKVLFSEEAKHDFNFYCKKFPVSAVVSGSLTYIAGQVSLDLKVYNCGSPYPKRLYSEGKITELKELTQKTVNLIEKTLLRQQIVAEVKIKGNIRMDADAIYPVLSLKAGDIFDPQKIREDIKNIYKLGYFDDVKVDVEQTKEGLVVTYIVREKPVVKRIVYQGNKAIKEKDLQKITELKTSSILNLRKIDEAAEKIKLFYKEKGFYDTKVQTQVKKLNPREVEVIFKIKEGKKIYIKKITFEGNKAFSDNDLKKLLEVSEKGHFSWLKKIKTFFTGGIPPGVYSYGGLYRSLPKIVAFYQNHGYIDVKVGEPRIKRKGEWVYITIPIEEGPRYTVGQVDIKQDLFKDKEFILKKLELPKKKYFSREALRRDILKITDLFADKGYAYARVEPIIRRDLKKHQVDVIFKVDKGPLVYVNRIEITGNTRTRDNVIRRELLIVEQRPFSATRLRKSENRLRRLGYFEDVRISTEKGVKEDQMNIKVKVKEQPTGTFSIGAGYSSVDKFVFTSEISQRNFLGKGQTLALQGYFSSRTTRYKLSFTDPYFRDSKFSLGLNAYDWTREYDDYTRKSQGFGINIGYLWRPDIRFHFGYQYDDSNLTDYSEYTSAIIRESADIHITSSIELGVTRDSRNHFFDPSRGSLTSIFYEHAGGFLGGDSAYEKITANFSFYHPLFKDLVGHIRVGAGYITEGSGGKLPVFKKFYLGGLDSVRGYRYGDISPIDPATGERIGGEQMFFVQTEAIFPLVKSMGLKGVVFFDMGNAWDPDTGYRFSDLRKSVGFGLRWLSPLGPMRIEWGFNIDTKPGEEKSNWNFRIGGVF